MRAACAFLSCAGALFLLHVACTDASSTGGSTDPTSAQVDAEPRFGSHAQCDASAQCPDGEACGYLISEGCAARGECIRDFQCSEHVPTWCGCDGKTHYEECPAFAGDYWAPIAVQASGFCPSDDAGPAPCDGAPPGGSCSVTIGCCGGAYCSSPTLRCCLPAYAQCSSDDECCGRRCTDENSGLRRCL